MKDEVRSKEQLINELEATRKRVKDLEELLTKREWSDELSKILIVTSPIGIYIVQDRKFRLVSPRFHQILGYHEDELIGMDPLDIVVPEDREMVREKAIKMLKKERSSPYEFRVSTKHGEIKWIVETVTSVQFQGRRAALGNFMDITMRKRAEEINNCLRRISEAAICAPSLEELFGSIHKIVQELMPARNFCIALYDHDREIVSFPYFVDERHERPLPRKAGGGLTEYVIRTGEALLASHEVIEELKKSGEVEPSGEAPLDWLGVPLKSQDKVIGVLAVQSYTEGIRYGEEEKNVLTFVSNQVALAIERRRKEEELKETQELLQSILSCSPLGIALVEDRTIRWTNEAMVEIFGYEDMEEFMTHCARIVYASEEEYERVGQIIYDRLKEGKPVGIDAKFKRRDGSIFDGHLKMSAFDPSVPRKRAVVTLSDITWRKEIEAALAAEKDRLAVTLRSIGDGVICTDAAGRVVLMNSVAEELTGWSEEEAVGKQLNDVFYIINEKTRKRCDNPVEKVLETGGVVGLANHTVLVSRDGTERILADTGAPIRGKDGEIIGVVLVFRDVTERRRIADELQKIEKLESIGVLAGGIAHDFNNILMGILGNIALAKMYAKSDNKVVEKLVEAEEASLRARALTQQLLTFSKGGAPVKKEASIAELIKDSVTFALTGSSVRCEFFLPDDLWAVEVDEGQMNQVINNLVINAEQAMPEGGVISVRAENTVIEKEYALPLKQGRYVKISIEDQGVGIPKEHLSRVFDPYFTTKQKGSGLGLTTAYSIIKEHDGYIGVESKLGEGTCFNIYLPASEKRIVKKEGVQEIIPTGKGRILLMDDEEIVRDVACEMLKSLGYEVESAREGAEAIDLYKKARESGDRFDVVIMDLTVPGGMGGKEAVKELLEMDPGVRAIVSSGYSNDPVMSDFRKYGFKGVVAKPYRMKDLAEVLRRVIAEEDE
nr:PAS domain S-box protein [Desulfobacterales bacterium]